MSSSKDHWETIYKTKDYKSVGWYQEIPEISLQLLSQIGAKPTQSIIDVGCGASLLVDNLIEQGYSDITLNDISDEALSCVRNRLDEKGITLEFLIADITEVKLTRNFDIWHDRAVFHFLTDANDRKKYMLNLAQSLSSDGRAIISAFSMIGPTKCSGLDVVQYDETKMCSELHDRLEIESTSTSVHETPNGGKQAYMHFVIKPICK